MNNNSKNSSHLLEPFKVIGLVTNHVVPAISFQSSNGSAIDSDLIDDALIYSAIGNTFYAYGVKSLIHIDIGPQLPAPICNMLVERQSTLTTHSTSHPTQRDILFVACEEHSKIYVLRGARELITIIDTSKDMTIKSGKIIQLLKIGQYLLVCFEHAIAIYDTFQIEDPFVTLCELPKDSTLTCAIHLQTYLDKLIIGTKEGHFILYNFRVGKEIYRFSKHLNTFLKEKKKINEEEDLLHSLLNTQNTDSKDDTVNVSVTCIKASPALDVIAVGLSSGHTMLYHVKYDHIINVFKQTGPVSAISFRTTSPTVREEQLFSQTVNSEDSLATGNHTGEISIFDLNNNQLIHRIKKNDRHTGPITCCEFLPGEPFMITASADNVMCTVVFDRVDKPREVVCRMGHKKAPKIIRFYDPMGNYIVTGGVDGQIRVTSLIDPKETRQISQAENSHLWKQANKNQSQIDIMPAVTDMDICYLRQDDWNNLACCHSNLNRVTLWNIKYLRSDNQTLYKPELKFGIPQSVALSICGNFSVVGTNKGYLEKWIVQSKNMKHLYTTNDIKKESEVEIRKVYDFKGRQKKLKNYVTKLENVAHNSSINSVIIDNTNTKVCSGGHDGLLKIWRFDAEKVENVKDQLIASFDLKSPILKMVKSKNSASANFVSVATENFKIHVFDLNTCKLIRTFHGHHVNKVNDMCFTHDNRYLVSCGIDGYILIYDILTGQLIDWLLLPKPATSLDFHPEGLYLVTTHVGSVGVCIWANKAIFGNALLQSVNAPKPIALPFSGDSMFVTERSTVDVKLLENSTENSKKKRKRAMKILSKVDDWMKQDGSDSDDSLSEDSDEEEEDVNNVKKANNDQTSISIQEPANFIKLSGLPKYKWHSLTHLDELRKRNKLDGKKGTLDLEELDVSGVAPFFIPTEPTFGKNIKFAEKSTESKILQNSSNKMNRKAMLTNPLIANIKKDKDSSSNSYINTLKYIKESNVKHVDLAVRTLSAFNQYEEYKLILDFFLHYLEVEYTEFDLIQAMINLFLQIHAEILVDAIRDDDQIRQFVDRLSSANTNSFKSLDDMNKYNQCMIDYMSFGGVFI
ncbi:predicted protein [Naegleria gruberi]|uniref:Predicted protein n=1 Tax=Naegleria gruberi TaxID=5762 RepID=D2UYM4_NAEGR|nr:uncharacterized protein NAEGRDRAFT_77811 [Naegleria gruberi]EFC50498.1 predicted protein [Naegleria gruberi]|eukprot:XP_002683242.1 predicted protein [Naegleria gruberi strain NEG-M]